MQFLIGSVWFAHFDRDWEFSSLPKERPPLTSSSFSLPIFKVTSLHDFLWLWRKVLICLLLLTTLPLGAWNALSVYTPACILTLIAHSLSFYSLVIALWLLCVRPTSNDTCGLWGEGSELLNKGNAAKMGKCGTLLMWFYVPRAEQIMSFFYPFRMCMILCLCVCKPVCMWEFICCWSHVSVCLCYEKDYFESTYPVTQQWVGRMPSERNSRSPVCTLYDSSCLFVFLPYMSSAIFSVLSLSLSIPLFLSVISLKSCTVFLRRSELLQNL